MRTKENPLLVSFDNWHDCVHAMQTEYTLTFKDLCKRLKCSRSWAVRYLKPHLHYIYLSNGSGQSPNYVRAANRSLDRNETASTWYSETEFNELIKNYIVSATRQTINIPIEYLVDRDKVNLFYANFVSLERLNSTKNINEYYELIDRRNAVMKHCATDIGLQIWEDEPSPYKRSETPAIKVTPNEINTKQLLAVHDLKDYGDSDEEIYRILFKQGAIRLVLELPDSDGVISQKIYYQKDPLKITDTIEWVLVKYQNYLEYLHQ